MKLLGNTVIVSPVLISVTYFSRTTKASFLIFGTEHQYGELYSIGQFQICCISTSCLTELRIFLNIFMSS